MSSALYGCMILRRIAKDETHPAPPASKARILANRPGGVPSGVIRSLLLASSAFLGCSRDMSGKWSVSAILLGLAGLKTLGCRALVI